MLTYTTHNSERGLFHDLSGSRRIGTLSRSHEGFLLRTFGKPETDKKHLGPEHIAEEWNIRLVDDENEREIVLAIYRWYGDEDYSIGGFSNIDAFYLHDMIAQKVAYVETKRLEFA